jgi:hypothetical protein
MSVDMNELEYLVHEIMTAYPQDKRWPSNIIDEVFKIIEDSRYKYLPRYRVLIGKNGEHKYAVNPQIGRLVKDFTGLNTIKEVPAALSTLIESYTELGK